MGQDDTPKTYLVTPAAFDPTVFPDRLDGLLARLPVACLRMTFALQDEIAIRALIRPVAEIARAHEIPLVIDRHVGLAVDLGLDGVHLTDGARAVRAARERLGPEGIVGAFCGTSRHSGMTAGEAGADYVAFGPVGETALGDGTRAPLELFEWWAETIEIPLVAEGALDAEAVRALWPHVDFFAIGDEIWSADDPVSALRALVKRD